MKKKVIQVFSLMFLLPVMSYAHSQEHVATTAEDGDNSVALLLPSETKRGADGFDKFRFGGYGELLFQHLNYGPNRLDGSGTGSLPDNRSLISMPRFVLAFDYKFTPSWVLGAEIEFEYGGTGAGIEAEYGEGVEYEYEFEKGGEVALEQFHITKIFSPAFRIRAGHMIVPVGLTNAHHEPIHFFGTTRPEGESTLIPCTWHETGIAVLGTWKHLSYEAMVVSGLDPYGFSSENWIQQGRQTKFEVTQMTNPAYALRLAYEGLAGARFGLSGYYAPRTNKNATNPSTTQDFKGTVAIASADAQYRGYGWTARANVLYGYVGDAVEINKLRPNKYTGYPSTPVAQNALTYFGEVGYDIGRLCPRKFSLIPFVRYEYYNTMENEATGTVPADKRFHVDLFSAGLNYYPMPNLVLKADFTHRRIDHGNYRSENTFGLGIAYIGWFFSK